MIVPIACWTKSSKVVSGDVCPDVKLEAHLFRKYKPKWKPCELAPQLGPNSLLNNLSIFQTAFSKFVQVQLIPI